MSYLKGKLLGKVQCKLRLKWETDQGKAPQNECLHKVMFTYCHLGHNLFLGLIT
jgi:hypothetical protein